MSMKEILNNMQWVTPIVNNYAIDPYALYLKLYNKFPSMIYIRNFDLDQGIGYLRKHFGEKILHEFTRVDIDCNTKKEEQDRSYLILEEELVFEVGTNYCDIYFNKEQTALLDQLKPKLTGFKKRSRNAQQEINIIAKGEAGLELMDMEVKRVKLDIEAYYEDDLQPVDAVIRHRLNKPNDKGIVLMYGIPGTGKTTYLRYLIGKIKKKVLFIPPNLAGQIADPDLIKLLIDNPDSVLIIEDAENIIMQRTAGQESAVSNLLNISDGLLSDFLNVQLICTFNSPISLVDDALLRKGRLIAKYEFKKLNKDKAQRLSDKLGFTHHFEESATLADIFNQHEPSAIVVKNHIGFRQGYMK